MIGFGQINTMDADADAAAAAAADADPTLVRAYFKLSMIPPFCFQSLFEF